MDKQKIRYIIEENIPIELIICESSIVSYPLHNHSSVIVIGMVLNGEVQLNINKLSFLYKKDEIFIIPPYIAHSITSQNTYSLLTLCINKNFYFDTSAEIIEYSVAQMLNYALISKYINAREFGILANNIKAIQVNRLEQKHTEIDTLVNQIKYSTETIPNIDTMAQLLYTSKFHFIRIFKQTVGLTPYQFQLQTRIRKAQKLLCQNRTITEVAFSTGFCDQSHFIKRFKKVVGLSPTTFRKSCFYINNN